jgi:predicted aminopeptidase
VFARGDTDFNEAFATTVGEEGGRRWLKMKGDSAALEKYLAHVRRTREFAHLVMETRAHLEVLFGDERTAEGQIRAGHKPQVTPAARLREQKQQLLAELKQEYGGLKSGWGGDTEYDSWFTHQVNNAHLNSVAAYYDLVPGFEQLLANNGGDLELFYTAAKRLAKEPKKRRYEMLRELTKARPGARAHRSE